MSGRAGQWWDILLITVSFGARLHSRAALDPFPLEGRMELFLSRPQYSSSHVFLGKRLGAERVYVRPQGLLPDLINVNGSLLTLSCFPPQLLREAAAAGDRAREGTG